jgi:hypothetical protein
MGQKKLTLPEKKFPVFFLQIVKKFNFPENDKVLYDKIIPRNYTK